MNGFINTKGIIRWYNMNVVLQLKKSQILRHLSAGLFLDRHASVEVADFFFSSVSMLILIFVWASSRENLSSGFATRWDSNQSAWLQQLARVLKFWLQQEDVPVLYYPGSEKKGADQTAPMRRLVCAFVVRIWYKQVFSWHGSFYLSVDSWCDCVLRPFTLFRGVLV